MPPRNPSIPLRRNLLAVALAATFSAPVTMSDAVLLANRIDREQCGSCITTSYSC